MPGTKTFQVVDTEDYITMSTHPVHFIQLAIIFFLAVLLQSCAQYEIPKDVGGPAFIEVSSNEITAGSGEHQTIWVTVLDGSRRPLPNVLVQAKSNMPSRALVTPDSLLTNNEGIAIFTLTGIADMPGRANITFTADGLSAAVRTHFIVW